MRKANVKDHTNQPLMLFDSSKQKTGIRFFSINLDHKPFFRYSSAHMQQTAIQDAQLLVQNQLQAVDQAILQNLESRVPLIPEVGQYLINCGGKRIRPLILLLMAKACGQCTSQHIMLAAIIEFIHSATLLHDDVVDDSTRRRGKSSANSVWGNPTSILVGDFLHSRAFQMINSLRNFTIIDILASTTNVIAEGEVLQLSYRHNPDLTQEQYHHIITCKTAKLFEAACLLGATFSHQSLAEQNKLGAYGIHLGCAFQLIDDLMDYQADPKVMGKNIGDDLREGKVTLPLLWALQNGTPAQVSIIRESIEQGSLKDLDTIQTAIISTGAIDYTLQKAQTHADLAIASIVHLPPSEYKTALISLANFSVERVS